jgi:predicted alpha/beta superfamily hydrolase
MPCYVAGTSNAVIMDLAAFREERHYLYHYHQAQPDAGSFGNSTKGTKMKSLLTFILATIWLYGNAQYPGVEIQGSQIRKITSALVTNQEYELHIMLPSGYENSNKKYPVLYLMDSQWDFPLVTALYGQQYFDGFVPSVIIVGVTWGGTNPNPDSLRARDYTPTKEARSPQSGGAATFLSFMEKELFPFVEKNFKADTNDRTLMGCSLGGLFTLYALFTKPLLFQKYVAATPAIGWDNAVIYQFEKKYSLANITSHAKLFMCFGGVERGLPGFKKLVKHLSQRNYQHLQIQSGVLENIGHSGTKGEGYERGLQYVFGRASLKVRPPLLKKFVGIYKFPDGSGIETKVDNNQLVLYFSPTDKYVLHAATESTFYSTAEFLNISFQQDGNKNINALQIERFGGTKTANKLKKYGHE